MNPPEQLQVLISVPHELEAAAIVNVLGAHGIAARAVGGHISGFKAEVPGNVDVVVHSNELEQARSLLAQFHGLAGSESTSASDEVPMDEAARDIDVPEGAEDDELSRELRRAWDAAVVGIVLFPPLLHFYSLWLLLRHDLLVGDTTGRPAGWQAYAALTLDLLMILLGALLLFLWLSSRPSVDEML